MGAETVANPDRDPSPPDCGVIKATEWRNGPDSPGEARRIPWPPPATAELSGLLRSTLGTHARRKSTVPGSQRQSRPQPGSAAGCIRRVRPRRQPPRSAFSSSPQGQGSEIHRWRRTGCGVTEERRGDGVRLDAVPAPECHYGEPARCRQRGGTARRAQAARLTPAIPFPTPRSAPSTVRTSPRTAPATRRHGVNGWMCAALAGQAAGSGSDGRRCRRPDHAPATGSEQAGLSAGNGAPPAGTRTAGPPGSPPTAAPPAPPRGAAAQAAAPDARSRRAGRWPGSSPER